MGLRDAIDHLKLAARAVTGRKTGPGAPWLFSGSPQAPLVGAWTDSRVEQVRHFKYWSFVAITKVAEAVASQFPNVSAVRPDEHPADRLPSQVRPERWLAPGPRAKALTSLQEHEQLEPVPHDHPLVRLLRDANPEDTGFDLWYETILHLCLTGNAYWYAPPNHANRPTELWCVPSHWMWPVPGRNRPIDHYVVRPVEGTYTGVEIDAADVIHFRRKSPVSKLDGYSPLTGGANWVDAAESIDKTRWHVFKNGPMPQLAVEFTEVNPDEATLARLEAKIMARYGGETRAGKPMFVPKGAVVKPLWVTPKELDFPRSFEQMRDAVLALFGVPGVVAGITKSMTYGSVLAAQAGFAKFTINPLLAMLGQTITEKLAARYDPRLRVWWPDQTPDDPNQGEKELLTDIAAGAVSVNEIRAKRGRKPSPKPEHDELIPGQATLQQAAAARAQSGTQSGTPSAANDNGPKSPRKPKPQPK